MIAHCTLHIAHYTLYLVVHGLHGSTLLYSTLLSTLLCMPYICFTLLLCFFMSGQLKVRTIQFWQLSSRSVVLQRRVRKPTPSVFCLSQASNCKTTQASWMTLVTLMTFLASPRSTVAVEVEWLLHTTRSTGLIRARLRLRTPAARVVRYFARFPSPDFVHHEVLQGSPLSDRVRPDRAQKVAINPFRTTVYPGTQDHFFHSCVKL